MEFAVLAQYFEKLENTRRFPRLVAFRERDKKPEDATTVKELIEMFENQGKK